jgi:hypothetical protein
MAENEPKPGNEMERAEHPPLSVGIFERLALNGDLSGLSAQQKIEYYAYRCRQLGLDPGAKPFEILTLNGKQVLYATKACSEQLTAVHKLSVQVMSREHAGGLYVVHARCSSPDGRFTDNDGAVSTEGLRGDALANSLMKATTKALRRSVLAHMGLGMLDETEVETIPGARRAPMPAVETRAPDEAAPPEPADPSAKLAAYAQRIEQAADLAALAAIAASAQKDLTRQERDELLPLFTRTQKILKGMRGFDSPSAENAVPPARDGYPEEDERPRAPAAPPMTGLNPVPWVVKEGVPHCKLHQKFPMKSKSGTNARGPWTRYWCTAKAREGEPANEKGYCATSGFDRDIFGEAQPSGVVGRYDL